MNKKNAERLEVLRTKLNRGTIILDEISELARLSDSTHSNMKRGKKPNEEKIKAYKYLLEQGYSQSQIARTFSVSRQSVSQFIQYHIKD